MTRRKIAGSLLFVRYYLAPTLWALLLIAVAIWRFVALLSRVERGDITRLQAALVYLPTLVLPVVFLCVFLVPPLPSIWNGDAGLALFLMADVLMGLMGLLNVVFWIALLAASVASDRGAA